MFLENTRICWEARIENCCRTERSVRLIVSSSARWHKQRVLPNRAAIDMQQMSGFHERDIA